MPSVRPAISVPSKSLRSQRPSRMELNARGRCRTNAISDPKNSSATEMVLPLGALITAMPSLVASPRSMLSVPTPARPMTRSFFAWRSRSPGSCVALRPTNASYSPIESTSSRQARVGCSSTSNDGSERRRSTPCGSTSSVTRMRSLLIRIELTADGARGKRHPRRRTPRRRTPPTLPGSFASLRMTPLLGPAGKDDSREVCARARYRSSRCVSHVPASVRCDRPTDRTRSNRRGRKGRPQIRCG